MATTPSSVVEFSEDDLDPIVDLMAELTAANAGWINFSPQVEAGYDTPPRTLFAQVFSANGEKVPLSTWSAPTRAGGRATVGIEHGSGPKALARLAEHDLALPNGWLKLNDHPRRGLVVVTGGGSSDDDVLWWLLASSHTLSVVPLTGEWEATVFRG